MSESKPITTAAYLGQYRRELIESGIPEFDVDSYVRDAARQILRDQGVTVGTPQPPSRCLKCQYVPGRDGK